MEEIHRRSLGGDRLWWQSGRMPCGQPLSGRYFLFPWMYGGRSMQWRDRLAFNVHAMNLIEQGVCAQNSNLLIEQCQDILPKEDPQALVCILLSGTGLDLCQRPPVWQSLSDGVMSALSMFGQAEGLSPSAGRKVNNKISISWSDCMHHLESQPDFRLSFCQN